MKRIVLSLILAFGLASGSYAGQQPPAAAGSADDIGQRRAQLEKDKAELNKNEAALKDLEKQVDSLKDKVKLQKDNVKMQEKRIKNMQKLNAMQK